MLFRRSHAIGGGAVVSLPQVSQWILPLTIISNKRCPSVSRWFLNPLQVFVGPVTSDRGVQFPWCSDILWKARGESFSAYIPGQLFRFEDRKTVSSHGADREE